MCSLGALPLVTQLGCEVSGIPRTEDYGTSVSLQLDVGQPDHLAPLLNLAGDEFTELGGRPRKHSGPKSVRYAFMVASARPTLISLLSLSLGWRVLGGSAAASPCQAASLLQVPLYGTLAVCCPRNGSTCTGELVVEQDAVADGT